MRGDAMITAKEIREVLDGTIVKKLDEFLDGVMMDGVLKQKQSPIYIDVSAMQKYVGSKRTDLVDMAIEMLERNGYIVVTVIRIGNDCGVTRLKVWW